MITKEKASELLAAAGNARSRALCKYSSFAVGAALLTEGGSVYLGMNIENSSYSVTVCAERVALFSALAAGERDFAAIAVIGGIQGSAGGYCPPCGVCLQALSEYCPPHMTVVLSAEGAPALTTLGELLPRGFKL